MISTPLKPVVRATPGQAEHLPAALRSSNQRHAARSACRECARRFQLDLADFPRDAEGLPRPVEGWHWSQSHTPTWVAALVYPHPCGIDVERVQQRRQELVRAAASHAEFELFGGFRWQVFARVFSAKEAVLKKAGAPLRELPLCRVVTVVADRGVVVNHRDRDHYVHQSFWRSHYVSVSADLADCAEIEWDLSERPPVGEER